MAEKQIRGIDLMKKIADKQEADRRLVMEDNNRRKQTNKHFAM